VSQVTLDNRYRHQPLRPILPQSHFTRHSSSQPEQRSDWHARLMSRSADVVIKGSHTSRETVPLSEHWFMLTIPADAAPTGVLGRHCTGSPQNPRLNTTNLTSRDSRKPALSYRYYEPSLHETVVATSNNDQLWRRRSSADLLLWGSSHFT
jgi:hypothetical protein